MPQLKREKSLLHGSAQSAEIIAGTAAARTADIGSPEPLSQAAKRGLGSGFPDAFSIARRWAEKQHCRKPSMRRLAWCGDCHRCGLIIKPAAATAAKLTLTPAASKGSRCDASNGRYTVHPIRVQPYLILLHEKYFPDQNARREETVRQLLARGPPIMKHLAQCLNDIHDRMIAGNRTASRDLFLAALDPLRGFLANHFRTLSDDDLHDLATDAIVIYVTAPERCDTTKSSLGRILHDRPRRRDRHGEEAGNPRTAFR